jgi:hypothetical protein
MTHVPTTLTDAGFVVSLDNPFDGAVNRFAENRLQMHAAFLVHASQ